MFKADNFIYKEWFLKVWVNNVLFIVEVNMRVKHKFTVQYAGVISSVSFSFNCESVSGCVLSVCLSPSPEFCIIDLFFGFKPIVVEGSICFSAVVNCRFSFINCSLAFYQIPSRDKQLFWPQSVLVAQYLCLASE